MRAGQPRSCPRTKGDGRRHGITKLGAAAVVVTMSMLREKRTTGAEDAVSLPQTQTRGRSAWLLMGAVTRQDPGRFLVWRAEAGRAGVGGSWHVLAGMAGMRRRTFFAYV